MPIRLDIKKKMTVRSDRVKSVDMHPTEPWVCCALYSGKVVIYNYSTSLPFKTFDVSELPVRCAKFISRKQLIITGADDMLIRVFNYNTSERVAQFEGHQDYIRYMEVHPSQPYVLTCSDDMQVRLWDWEKNWACVNTYEGHAHYVMMARINPKDTNTFATASLDRSVKVWALGAPTPNFSLEGHERGVNCVDYYPGGDKPYIVSGADDFTLKLWDYQTRSCVATLEGHTSNVCAVAFHARLPVILSGSEDGTVRVWHNTTYRLESTLNYAFERTWAISTASNSHKVALGFDDGTIVIKLGREVPVSSMDKSGKIITARNNVIYSASLRSAGGGGGAADGEEGESSNAVTVAPPALVDGESLSLAEKELGSVELFPQAVLHNSNGRFVAVVGDNEYVIYTAQALRNKSFGTALDFVWSSSGTGDYAVRESPTRIKVFKNFKEAHAFKPSLHAEGLVGGALLCARAADAVVFYDWDSDRVVRRIEVAAKGVYWNESGELVAITTDDSFFVLRFSRAAFAAAVEACAPGSADAALLAEEGVEAAFELQHEVSEKVRGGVWVGDCFVYTNSQSRLNYYVGGEVITLSHLDRHMYMLGYLAKEGRVYLQDKTGAVVSYALQLALLEYQTAVVRRDFGAANRILREIPKEQFNAIAKFLEGQGFKEEALAVADDPDIKFDLAVQLNKLDVAYELLRSGGGDTDSADTQAKWKALMDLALARSNIALAEECALAARDLSSLLLLYSSTGDAAGMARVAALAREDGRGNIAFSANLVLGRTEECTNLLIESGRFAEAAFFARTYAPSALARIMPLWKADASKHSKRAAEALAEPPVGPGAPDVVKARFPDFDVALKAESIFTYQRDNGAPTPASAYPMAKADLSLDLLETVKAMMAAGAPLPGTSGASIASPSAAAAATVTAENDEDAASSGSAPASASSVSSSHARSPAPAHSHNVEVSVEHTGGEGGAAAASNGVSSSGSGAHGAPLEAAEEEETAAPPLDAHHADAVAAAVTSPARAPHLSSPSSPATAAAPPPAPAPIAAAAAPAVKTAAQIAAELDQFEVDESDWS